MIEFLEGKVVHKGADSAILSVNGVGYGLTLPIPVACRLGGVGETAKFFIHTHVREDALRLFGFLSLEDKNLFTTLLGINGIGPKVALAIVSTLSLDQLASACANEELRVLETVPGIGRRSAERIMVELKVKLPARQGASLGALGDVRSALLNLGFKSKVIESALVGIKDDSFEVAMKSALQKLSSSPNPLEVF